MVAELWVEKYRPIKINDYVWRDKKQQTQIQNWIAEKYIPNLLLSGTQGVGKTSLINVILSEIGVAKGDRLYINASEETSIDVIRSKVLNFASTIPWGDFKVIVLEEADGLSLTAQQSLKRIQEDYSSDCRFILTTNNPHKIIPPIVSRCQVFHITNLDKDQFRYRLAEILASEGIEADLETLDNYIEATFPDLRKAINSIQMNCIDNRLTSPTSDSGSKTDWMVHMVELFKTGNITAAREFICENIDYTEYPEVFRFLYRNLNLFGDSEQQREDSLLVIRDGMIKDQLAADREINLSAMLVELRRIKEKR